MLYERIKLEDDEKVLKIVRKHWWIIVSRVLFTIFLAVIPLIVVHLITTIEIAGLGSTLNTVITETYVRELQFLFTAWLLLNWMMLANFWTDQYLDLWAITNRRVVLADQRGFFRRFLSSFRLERLQDMNIEVNGVVATLLDFGTIEAQTAGGSNEEFISHNMPHPRDIKALIVRSADELNKEQPNRIDTLKEQGL